MIRILSLVIAVSAFIGATILILGYREVPEYSGSVEFVIDANIDLIWEELLKVQGASAKKRDVESVDMVSQYGKYFAWQENLENGGFRLYRTNDIVDKERLEIELLESSYGLTGVWVFELSQKGWGTVVKISEKSSLENVRIRGTRVILGRDHDLLAWNRYTRAGVIEGLLKKP